MQYQFLEQHKQEFPVVVMCQVLGVSESGFSAWRKRPICRRRREDAQLTGEIGQVFVTHRGRYGSPRIHTELKDHGRPLSRKGVARLMSEAALCAGRKRRRVLTTKRDASHPLAQSALKSGIYGYRTEPEMGERYHVYSNSSGMALSRGDPGRVFAGGGGMVHVNLLR